MTCHPASLLRKLIVTHSCRTSRFLIHAHPKLPQPSSTSVLAVRRFATTVAEPGSGRAQAVLEKLPRLEDLEEEDRVDLLDRSEAQLQITERAAKKLRTISVKEGNPSLALRIGVESGGCHGYQYRMELTEDDAPDDYRFSHPTHRPSSIVVDAVSLGLLKGSTIDYETELIGSSFRILDNPQSKGNGCGCGISWEAKF